MLKVLRTDAENRDFRDLVKQLDAELAIVDGEEHSFYSQFNKIDKIKHVVIAYHDENPIACGAMKEYNHDSIEIKRMYVSGEYRKMGIATMVLIELEKWAYELSYKKSILETGIRQPDAIALYKKNGYILIPNWGQYVGIENSVCFEKMLGMLK